MGFPQGTPWRRAVVFAAAPIVLATMAQLLSARRLAGELDDARKELEKFKAEVQRVSSMEQEASRIKVRIWASRDLRKQGEIFLSFLSDLRGTVPSGVSIRSLNTGVPAFKGDLLTIKSDIAAESRTDQDMEAWLSAMRKNSRFSEPELLLGPAGHGGGQGQARRITLTTVYSSRL